MAAGNSCSWEESFNRLLPERKVGNRTYLRSRQTFEMSRKLAFRWDMRTIPYSALIWLVLDKWNFSIHYDKRSKSKSFVLITSVIFVGLTARIGTTIEFMKTKLRAVLEHGAGSRFLCLVSSSENNIDNGNTLVLCKDGKMLNSSQIF